MRLIRTSETSLEGIKKIIVRPLEQARAEEEAVKAILEDIKNSGDDALLKYTAKFDRVSFATAAELKVTEQEIDEAHAQVDETFLESIRLAKENITKFHQKQVKKDWFMTEDNGVILGRRYTPLDAVGIYIPAGTAPLISTILMNAIPAQVAGVERIVMVAPPGRDGKIDKHLLAAARELGITEIYKVGGAQAIGALAFGTETIKKVDKIVGPGNIYVVIAKKLVFGHVGIEMLPGPSEIVVIADETANPVYAAADLLSQAEHDPNSMSVLLTTSEKVAQDVNAELDRQTQALNRKDIINKSLGNNGAIIVVKDLDEAVMLSNICAPEHLELLVEEPFTLLGKVKHAGAVFLGQYSSEPVGDYVAGTNHVLPTNGTARFSAGLSVDEFVKGSSVIAYTLEGLKKVGPAAIDIATREGLEAHANAVRVRLEGGNK